MATSFWQRFIPGFRLIDGSDLNRALAQPVLSTETAIVAAGTTIADATTLNAAVNVIGTAAASTGVKLRADAPVGSVVTVYNDGASAIKVYALGDVNIDAVAGTVGVTLTNGNRAQFTRVAGGGWKSALLGATSS